MKAKRPKCPQCRGECVKIIQFREAVFARNYPIGQPKLIRSDGRVLRYKMQCLKCLHSWRPLDQIDAASRFSEVTQ